MHFCILGPLHRAVASEDISPYGEVYLYNTIAKSNLVSKVLIGSVCLIINTLFYIKSVTGLNILDVHIQKKEYFEV